MIGVALSLSACVAVEQPPTTDTPEISSDRPSNAQDEQTAARTPQNERKDLTPLSANKLIGQKKDALLKLLGTPRFKRRDAPAEIWRYRNETCLLDLYFYPPKGSDDTTQSQVTYIEARTPQGPSTPVANCLNALRHKFVTKATS
ncbi:MAG: hypothetical protein ACPGPC_03700 [Alphaproteobacteria bacterium]